MSSGGLWSWPSRPCEWPARRLRGRPVSRTVTLRRARPSCRAPARPAKLPPMMMTSSMVMGSGVWMEGVGLGLARNIVQLYALETGSEQGFGLGEKPRTMPHSSQSLHPEAPRFAQHLRAQLLIADGSREGQRADHLRQTCELCAGIRARRNLADSRERIAHAVGVRVLHC